MAYPRPTGYAPAGVNYPVPHPRPRTAPNPLSTDPGVVQAGLARNQADQQANATLRQLRSQALIGYGDPNLARSLGLAVDPNTAGAAGANRYSTLAELLRQHTNAQQGITNSLAARHLIHSGELGYEQGQEAHAYGGQQYAAKNQLLGQLNQYLQNYLGTRQGATNQYVQALLGAQQNYGQNVLGGLV